MRRGMIAAVTLVTVLKVTAFGSAIARAAQLASSGTQIGVATCYSRMLTGNRTSSGKRYNPRALTAAHRTIANGTRVKVTNLDNGKSVVVTVDDKLPDRTGGGIIMDISHQACRELGFGRGGEAKVKIEIIRPGAVVEAQ